MKMEKIIFIEYPKCSTCQKAKKWLEEKQIIFEDRNIITNTPTAKELQSWVKKSGLPLRRFFNTSGMKYRELKLSEKLADMPEAAQYSLLASDGMLIKRPLLVTPKGVIPGFKIEAWEPLLTPET